MNTSAFRHFGELYRAAFAERDPEKKSLLLSEVKRTIELSDERRQPRSEKKEPRRDAIATQTA